MAGWHNVQCEITYDLSTEDQQISPPATTECRRGTAGADVPLLPTADRQVINNSANERAPLQRTPPRSFRSPTAFRAPFGQRRNLTKCFYIILCRMRRIQ